jgi:hypothetical protein
MTIPLDNATAELLLAVAKRQQEERARKMPCEKDAIRQLFEAHQRLEELGWKNIIYCPKDGSMFQAIEAGSTGIFECNYDGKWPNGSWWIYSDGDVSPSYPILFKKA